MSEPYNAIQVVMMPRDTNPVGTIFGGVILSYIDMAGSIAARRGSRNGGSANFSPSVASGSSVAKPGPSVAISNRMPFGSRK